MIGYIKDFAGRAELNARTDYRRARGRDAHHKKEQKGRNAVSLKGPGARSDCQRRSEGRSTMHTMGWNGLTAAGKVIRRQRW